MHAIQTPEEFVKSLIPFYENKRDEAKQLISKFEEKETLGLWWDSKVPEKDKVGWNEFWAIPYKNINWSGVSDKGEVISEVKNFFKFYEEIEALAQEINEIILEKGIGTAEPEINFLSERLQDAVYKAEREKDTANSSTIYNSHLSLVLVQSEVVSELQLAHLKSSQARSLELTNKLERSENLSENYRQLYDGSERRNQKLEEINQELRGDNKEIKQNFEDFKEQVTTFMQNVTIDGGMSLCK